MSDFIKEILSSLKKTSTERISNPFYGVFIVTWLVYNWEGVAIMLFSDMKMQERVRFINSAYPFMYILPFCTAVFLTFVLPWCTEKITFFQSKPLSRTSSLLAIRKKRMLISDISVERYRAKKDVAYERYKVGAEKEVQDMKERIILSTERTGELTASLKESQDQVFKLKKEISSLSKVSGELQIEKAKSEDLKDQLKQNNEMLVSSTLKLEEYRNEYVKLKSEFDELTSHNSQLVTNNPTIFFKKSKDGRLFLKPQKDEDMIYSQDEIDEMNANKKSQSKLSFSQSLDEFMRSNPKLNKDKDKNS